MKQDIKAVTLYVIAAALITAMPIASPSPPRSRNILAPVEGLARTDRIFPPPSDGSFRFWRQRQWRLQGSGTGCGAGLRDCADAAR